MVSPTVASDQGTSDQETAHPQTPGLGWLAAEADARRDAGLHRVLIPRSPESALMNLSSNDYLGLSGDSRVIAGAQAALVTWGSGAGASRLVSGTVSLHHELEDQLAGFAGYDAALVFSSGYLANVGTVAALAGRGDLIVSDAGSHASLIDGCRLSRADVVVVDRGDVAAVRVALADRTYRRALVVTDSVCSIDGALAPLPELYAASREFGATLVVDEAHALGVRGPGGRGLLAEHSLAGAPDLVTTAVLSKSLGAQGGVVFGPSILREHLIDRARTFIFDTGLAPASAGAALAALRVLIDEPELATRVRANARRLAAKLVAPQPDAAVVSLILGDPDLAVEAARQCRTRGLQVGCFRPPSVPEGTSRLRLTVRADLSEADIDRAATDIAAVLAELGV